MNNSIFIAIHRNALFHSYGNSLDSEYDRPFS